MYLVLGNALGGTGDNTTPLKAQMQIRPVGIQTQPLMQSSGQSQNLLPAGMAQSQAFIQASAGLHGALSQSQVITQGNVATAGLIQAQQLALNPVRIMMLPYLKFINVHKNRNNF